MIPFQAVATDVPDCVLQSIETNGANTLHIYFNDQPWKTTCPAKGVRTAGYSKPAA